MTETAMKVNAIKSALENGKQVVDITRIFVRRRDIHPAERAADGTTVSEFWQRGKIYASSETAKVEIGMRHMRLVVDMILPSVNIYMYRHTKIKWTLKRVIDPICSSTAALSQLS